MRWRSGIWRWHEPVRSTVVRQRRPGRRTLAHPFIRVSVTARWTARYSRDTSHRTRSSSNPSPALTRWPCSQLRYLDTDRVVRLIAGVATSWALHNSYAARWGIDMAGVEPSPATLAYTDFLLATAATCGLGMMLAAMTPCMRLYAWLGASLDAGAAGQYAEWVQTYADPGFDDLASQLEDLLDQHADDSPAVRRPTGERCTSRCSSSTRHCPDEIGATGSCSGVPRRPSFAAPCGRRQRRRCRSLAG